MSIVPRRTRQYHWEWGVYPVRDSRQTSPRQNDSASCSAMTTLETHSADHLRAANHAKRLPGRSPATSSRGTRGVTVLCSDVGHRLGIDATPEPWQQLLQRDRAPSFMSSDTCSGIITSISALTAIITSRSISATSPPNARYAIRQMTVAVRRARTTLASIMHYGRHCPSRWTCHARRSLRKPQYASADVPDGSRHALSETDHNMMAVLYFSQMTRERDSHAHRAAAQTLRSRRHAAGDGAAARRST